MIDYLFGPHEKVNVERICITLNYVKTKALVNTLASTTNVLDTWRHVG